jgi:hypothetical protein
MTAHKNEVSEVVDGFSGRLVHNTNCLNNVFSFDNYGAVGDGVTDDTEAIKRCIAEASLISYSTIKSTPGKTYMISDTITVNTNMNIDLEGDMVYTGTNDRPAFVVGSTSKTLTLIKVNLSIYSKKYSDYSDFVLNGECDNMNIGVRLINIGQSEINIRNSKKFTVGVQCIATNSKGFYFNNLYINTHSNMCELEVTNLTKGWINGNKFKSITFQKSSGIKTTTDLYGILIHSRDNSYIFNSNWFGDVTSEGYGGNRAEGYRHYLVYLNHCSQHVIEFSRIENSTQDTFAYFGSGAEYCKVVKPPLLFTTSTAVEFADTRTRSLNAVIGYPGAYGTKCNNLIYDTGDLREDVYVTSSGHYASKKYYHTDFDYYKKMEYSKYPVTITSDRITWSSYSKPFMVIDTSEVKRIYYKAYNAAQSQEGVSFKFYFFFLDENDEVITLNNDTVLKDYVEYVNPTMYVPSTAPWFAQSAQNLYGSQVGTLTVTDKVKSVGIMFNNIIRFQLYADDVFTPIIREEYFKQGRIYVGRTGYQITESDTGVTLTKL